MRKIIALFLVLTLMAAATTSAWPTSAPPPPAAGGSHFGTGHGVVSVGAIMVTAASLIACAIIVSHREHRELNSREVFWASLIPLGCLLVPR